MSKYSKHARWAPVAAAALVSLSGCSSLTGAIEGDKLDYRSATKRATQLDVPPDLTQLPRDQRYQIQGGAVSAATQGAGGSVSAASQLVAPLTLDGMKISRVGETRWLSVKATPEQLWPQLKNFWTDLGLTLATDKPEAGILETDWAENRAKLPRDLLRATLGKFVDGAYDTGERDMFRMRVERNAEGGTDIYVAHRGLLEIAQGQNKDDFRWRARPADSTLEGEMLSRLMLRLANVGGDTSQAKAKAEETIKAAPGVARATLVGTGADQRIELSDAGDAAWRNVSLALDRAGFTVEERNRNQGTFSVRITDNQKTEDRSFWQNLKSIFSEKEAETARFTVAVTAQGGKSVVTLKPQAGSTVRPEVQDRLIKLLAEELK